MTERPNPAKQKAKAKGEKIRAVIDGLASGLFPDRPFKNIFRTRVKQLKERKFQPQQTQGQNPMPQIQERFSQRPRLMDFLQQSQEQQQPELNPEEAMILEEHRKQMMEDAEARANEEQREKESQEQVERLKRAKERMSIENLR